MFQVGGVLGVGFQGWLTRPKTQDVKEQPKLQDAPDAVALPAGPLDVKFRDACFR